MRRRGLCRAKGGGRAAAEPPPIARMSRAWGLTPEEIELCVRRCVVRTLCESIALSQLKIQSERAKTSPDSAKIVRHTFLIEVCRDHLVHARARLARFEAQFPPVRGC